MPFTSTPDLPANPDVRIFFTGLLILDPNPGPDPNPQLGSNVNTCEVFVNRSAPEHHLTVEVRRKRAGKPDVVLMRHYGDLSFRATPQHEEPRYGMFIRVIGGAHPKGVKRYDPAAQSLPSPEGDGLDLAFDLEGPQFHQGVVEVDKKAGRPSIVLNDATFYTAAKTRANANFILRKKDLATGQEAVVNQNLPPFASIIGANIYLDVGGQVIITWREHGLDKRLALEKPPATMSEAGDTFEIYVINDPLYEADDSPFALHDELGEYYRLLPKVRERFRVEIPPPQSNQPTMPNPDRGSTTTPCMPVVKGGGTT